MTPIVMCDATHDNVLDISPDAPMVAGYVTGSPDIKWTAADFARFPRAKHVFIDQGFTGSPVLTAHVRDVEPRAWTPDAAVHQTAGWDVPRPTIYCDINDLQHVLDAGWKGDLWLAIPSSVQPVVPPVVPGCTVVAVQWMFTDTVDWSAVFDSAWPDHAAPPESGAFDMPRDLHQVASVMVAWDAVPPVNGKAPDGYSILVKQLNHVTVSQHVVATTFADIPGLRVGWQYDVYVWANGGPIAPPHAVIRITP